MKKFSERIGATAPQTSLQVDSMNDDLRNSLWNLIYEIHYWKQVSPFVAKHLLKIPVDDIPTDSLSCRDWLKEYFFSLAWYDTYNFIEFIADNHEEMTRHYYGDYNTSFSDHDIDQDELKNYINHVLEKELSAYRFISGVLSPISDKVEKEAISDAIQASDSIGFIGAEEHLRTALKFLSKKPDPTYRNSIKESISAVESIAKKISSTKSRGLDGALEELSKASEIHSALKAGFKSLYGYSSDAGGIRHAILDEPNIGFAEAKYMLVSCSSFVHYMIQKADQAGLLKR